MKKQILNIGKALKKVEQKQINGGGDGFGELCLGGGSYDRCFSTEDCIYLHETCIFRHNGMGECVCPD
jgi:hypothetical protein